MEKLSPMMQQYMKLKDKHKDCIVFFRLGDFYEMFFDDAILASKELEIALTGRDCGLEKRAPMCGVPFHSADRYIDRLLNKGYKVAICEQIQEPGPGIKLVDRDVVRIVTPGTMTENASLNEKENNFILSLFIDVNQFGFAYSDVSTGAFYIGEKDLDASYFALLDELHRINPNEVIINTTKEEFVPVIQDFFKNRSPLISVYPDWAYELEFAKASVIRHFKVKSLDALGAHGLSLAVSAAGGLLEYLKETQKISLAQINRLSVNQNKAFMFLDMSTRRNLELTQTIRDGSEKGSLLWVLDKTKTAMGARMLKTWVGQPLQNEADINARLDGVETFYSDALLRESIREELVHVYDLERLATRIAYGTIDPKSCISLKKSIENIPAVKTALNQSECETLKAINEKIDDLSDLFVLLNSAVMDEPAVTIKDGNIIKDGYDKSVDEYRDAIKNGDEWIAEIEKKEREATGIKNLKIGYNKIFGYYIEVTKSFLDAVPYRYTRKQTLASCERFITPELKDVETKKLSASEKCEKREYELFVALREEIMAFIARIQITAKAIAQIDVLQSLALTALENHYTRPRFIKNGGLEIIDGRHPVVEKIIKDTFVTNDTHLDTSDNRTLIITGPNMAGKSTYMRQVGLIVLMAHIGSFVPAKSLKTSLVDRIFTRVGAMDDLSSGQSTFMVEMNEVSNILRNATKDSLLILDEIGRGTSTLDGLSIAWAVTEHVNDNAFLGAKTMFATHYHELTELEQRLEGVKNYRITVKEFEDSVVFLHKIERGGTDRSFGIEVGKLAGLPDKVVGRAKNILEALSSSHVLGQDTSKIHDTVNSAPETDYAAQSVIETLKKMDIDDLSPKQALDKLFELKSKLD
ncbi:MAG: DNA mismatch repair protein MutS [Eubacteriales bacterium]